MYVKAVIEKLSTEVDQCMCGCMIGFSPSTEIKA